MHRSDSLGLSVHHVLVATDFFYADLMLEVGGIIVLDDAHMPGVHAVFDYAVTNRAYRWCDLQHT